MYSDENPWTNIMKRTFLFTSFLLFFISCENFTKDDEDTMFGPVWTMRYDTVRVSVEFYDIIQSFEIVLD